MMPSAERRAYQRQWSKRRREAWLAANGPCRKCGSTESLEVDHIDRASKKLSPNALWNCAKATRIAELAKCQVLCRKCHLEKTRRENIGRFTGDQNGRSKLSPDAVTEILRLKREGAKASAIAAQFGINKRHVYALASGARWPGAQPRQP